MQTALQQHLTAEDYLAWEETQVEKHEFVAGEVFAMVGARQDHVVVCGNIFAGLKQRLRGTPCRPYVADLKLRVDAADAFFYPDVMVSSHPGDLSNQQYISNPSLIVEVLSESTADYDRGGKFVAYRKLESLREYLIVDIEARRVECFRRTADNDWLLHDYVGDIDCQLRSLGIRIPTSEIFEDIA
ncbi:Uma2 family endonuclease [Methylomonas sp. UP202]|uniref:Uma2 family endonuclease n=1 Tax=Methylomonas sp. UP202 TaxID=3040943 RepID=UPI00143969B0|nr:Uma2 family endonuclease [Methylomonas sp. UP202]NJA04256.1 Uma2 family endonuclease [Methylococcaceae bacterium WWC4]WGS85630.1 Uma2 family endonuclease [Methylomonas sp. UP202]